MSLTSTKPKHMFFNPPLTFADYCFLTYIAGIITVARITYLRNRRSTQTTHPFTFKFFLNNQTKVTGTMVQITVTQQVTGTLGQPVDKKGNPAEVEAGSVNYVSEDESIATVEEHPDNEMSFVVKATGKPGVTRINVTADADTGEGVTTLSDFFGVEVKAGMAVGFGAPAFGTPEEQPEVEEEDEEEEG